MLFSSLEFLYGFLALVLLVYFVVPAKFKNLILLIFSLGFYFWGEQGRTVIMLVCIAFSYVGGLLIARLNSRRAKKAALIVSVGASLAILAVFKYADFFIGNINSLFNISIPFTGLALPIGISFFTFQALSYTVDVYRGEVAAQKSPIKLATYVSLFPQLIAGPIVRYTDVAKELDSRTHSFELFSKGIARFMLGLAKKVLVANVLYALCQTFRQQADPTTLFYWLYAVSYTLHLYFDFSGYSDMAIGLGKMFGFHFNENFNYPFISRSFSEFWRRWHMSLGTWFRDYVYFPLGGSRVSKLKLVRNLFVVWLLTGLWHGAAWNFVIWGVFFGIMLTLEKLFWGKALAKAPKVLQHIYVLLPLLASFVVFDSVSFTDMFKNLGGLWGIGTSGIADTTSLYYLAGFAPIIIISALLSTPAMKLLYGRLLKNAKWEKVITVATPLFLMVLLLCCTAFLVDGSFNPFLYFRF